MEAHLIQPSVVPSRLPATLRQPAGNSLPRLGTYAVDGVGLSFKFNLKISPTKCFPRTLYPMPANHSRGQNPTLDSQTFNVMDDQHSNGLSTGLVRNSE